MTGPVRAAPASPADREGGARAVAFAIARSALTGVLLVVAYALLPVKVIGVAPIVLFAAGAVLFALALTVQLRAISSSTRPGLRAIEAVGLLLGLIVVVFAAVYLIAATGDAHAFSQPLDRVGALYFAVTTLSTVGFGDIVAVSDSARILVTIQMLVDLVLVASVIRLVVAAVARSRSRSPEDPTP